MNADPQRLQTPPAPEARTPRPPAPPAVTLPRSLRATLTLARPFALRAVAAGAAIGILWMFVGKPLEASLRKATVENSESERKLGDFEALGGAARLDDSALTTLRARAITMNQWATPAESDTKLYEQLGALASKVAVRIDRMEPRSITDPAATRYAAPSPTAKDTGVKLAAVAYDIDATGSYENVAKFIDELDASLGTSKVTAFRIAPAGAAGRGQGSTAKPSDVSVSIQTLHMKLRIPVEAAGPAPLATETGAGPGSTAGGP